MSTQGAGPPSTLPPCHVIETRMDGTLESGFAFYAHCNASLEGSTKRTMEKTKGIKTTKEKESVLVGAG